MTSYVNGAPQPEPEFSGNGAGEVLTNGASDPSQQDPTANGDVTVNGVVQPEAQEAQINGAPV
jgi:hypothetical protein